MLIIIPAIGRTAERGAMPAPFDAVNSPSRVDLSIIILTVWRIISARPDVVRHSIDTIPAAHAQLNIAYLVVNVPRAAATFRPPARISTGIIPKDPLASVSWQQSRARERAGRTPIQEALMKELADVALNAAKSKGASYADIRFVRILRKFVSTREDHISGVTDTESYGFGVRALVDGTWGFAASSQIDKDTIARIAAEAVAIARANKAIQKTPIELVPEPAHVDVWQTPITKDPFKVPIDVQAEHLLAVNRAAMKPQPGYKFFCNSDIFSMKEEKIFASTEGTYTDQTLVRVWPDFTVTAVDQAAGTFTPLSSLAQPIGKGY
jgi:hypothetical protein